jgi:CRP/FNR family transcriptional regulator, cyclic AMP receptor protein
VTGANPWPELFGPVPERELRQLAKVRRFGRGEIVFHQDDPGDSLHVVTSGRLAARVTTELGESATLAIYGVGSAFGLLSVVRPGLDRTATMVALEPAETLQVSAATFAKLRAQYPALDQGVEQLLVDQLATTNRLLVEALYLPVQQRVRRRLLDLVATYGTPGTTDVVIPLSQEHLADLAGTTRETVNRVLRAEEEAGRVSLGRRQVTVHLAQARARPGAAVSRSRPPAR